MAIEELYDFEGNPLDPPKMLRKGKYVSLIFDSAVAGVAKLRVTDG